MPEAKFILSGDASKFLQEALKVGAAQTKMEGGFKRVSSEGSRSINNLEREMTKLQRASEQSAVRTVAAAKLRVGSQGLMLTAEQRSVLAGSSVMAPGGTDLREVQNIALQRRFIAQSIRENRSTARRAAADAVATANRRSSAEFRADATWRAGDAALAAMNTRMAGRESDRRARLDKGYEFEAELAGLRYEATQKARERAKETRQRLATGALAVGAAVVGVGQAVEQELEGYANAITSFDDVMAPLYGVGGNMRNRGALRRSVLATSGGTGMAVADVARMKYNLQSSASDLPTAVSDAIERSAVNFYRLQRTDPSAMTSALVGSMQILKGDLKPGAAGVQQLSNMIGYGADVGSFEIEKAAPYMAQTFAAFKAMGLNPAEALGSYTFASKLGMRDETYATGVRNMPLLMAEFEKKTGQKRAGSFVEQMKQLQKLPEDQVLDMFGRDSFVFAQAMRQDPEGLSKIIQGLSGQLNGGDFVQRKLSQAYSDPAAAGTGLLGSAKALNANVDTVISQDANLRKAALDEQVAQLGAAKNYGPLRKMLGIHKVAQWRAMAMESVRGSWLESPWADPFGANNVMQSGAQELVNASDAIGDVHQSGYASLLYGKYLNTYYQNKGGSKIFTGQKEAEEYSNLIGQGYTGLTSGEFLEYKRIGDADAQAGKSYLDRVGGFADPKKGDSAIGNIDTTILNRVLQKLDAALDRSPSGTPIPLPTLSGAPSFQ